MNAARTREAFRATMDRLNFSETVRRVKRQLESHLTSASLRRVFVVFVVLVVIFWLFGYKHLPYRRDHAPSSPGAACLEGMLNPFYQDFYNMDANILHSPVAYDDENKFLPYVGNGYLGLPINNNAPLSIKENRGRVLNVGIPFRPIVEVTAMDQQDRHEAFVSQYSQGLTHRLVCFARESGGMVKVSHSFFAHRVYPSVMVQNITITNLSGRTSLVQFDQRGWSSEPPFKTSEKRIHLRDEDVTYISGTGVVMTDKKGPVVVAVAYKKVPNAIQVGARESITVRQITVVNYAPVSSREEAERMQPEVTKKAEQEFKEALQRDPSTFFRSHISAWKELWNTGFYISPSRAEDALNGDKINATIYYVLSQVRAPLFEEGVSSIKINEANAVLSYAEGCYGGHHTLQAPKLWIDLQEEAEILNVCNLWLITLEKLGCHKLLKAGASGVMQGMTLSFGGLKFRNSHLEFNTEPKDLHRDYHFRRIWYGNSTHVNISVVVGEDNKAALYVALDRKDKDYFACDAGCLDQPLELAMQKTQFPVKITDPVTPILYITSDKRHVEELHLSIHVKEVVEAPAHEHHVISMHRHGSGYSAISTLFWVVLSLMIIVFHIFLFHLVYTEYFGAAQQDRYRSRYVDDNYKFQ